MVPHSAMQCRVAAAPSSRSRVVHPVRVRVRVRFRFRLEVRVRVRVGVKPRYHEVAQFVPEHLIVSLSG